LPTKILIADDDLGALKMTSLILQRQGYEIVVARDGLEALQQVQANSPDLIILDVMMPHMSGYEVCQRLRNEPSTADIPIIMFTAKTLTADKVSGFEAGADDYLTKPTQPGELTARIKALLARKGGSRGGSGQGGGMVLAFIGAKGGIGTSTTALNVATLISQNDQVLLADIRPGQGSLALMLGMRNQAGMTRLLKRPISEISRQTVEAELSSHRSGLKMLLSSAVSADVRITIEAPIAAQIVRQLRALSRTVVLDLGSGVTTWAAQIIRDTQEVALIIEPTPTSVMLANNIMEDLQNNEVSASRINPIVVNHVPSGVQLSWQEIQQHLGRELLAVIPPAAELAFRSAQESVAMVSFQPVGTIASQFGKIATDLMAKRGA
jgi:DNA-binding response OmpR family regulator